MFGENPKTEGLCVGILIRAASRLAIKQQYGSTAE